MKSILSTFMIVTLVSIGTNLFCQNKYITESESHIFWQSSRELSISDFQGGNTYASKFDRDREIGRSVIPCLGIFLEIDIPKNYRKNKLEKVYFAPAFEKSCSYILDGDTSNFKLAQLQFDIYELATRIARKLIWDLRTFMILQSDSTLIDVIENNPDTILLTGVGNIYAYHARDSAYHFASSMSHAVLCDLFLETDSTSATYEDWKSLVDDILKSYERFATKPEDCYRMIKGKPILKKYKEDK